MRPLGPPSVARQMARLHKRLVKVERRFIETEAVAGIVLRAHHHETGGKTIGSDTETPITFADWENEDSSIFDETLSSGALQKVGFLAQGLYTITLKIIWETSFAAHTGVLLLDDSTTTGNWPFGETGNMSQWGNGDDSDSFDYPFTASVTEKFPRYTTAPGDVSGGEYGRVFVKIIQRSGSNKDLQAATLTIIHWGPSLTSI
jgi:hypothetical protein